MNEQKEISKRFVIAGTLLIWTIKYIIRPVHIGGDPLSFLLNVAPNFLGSFLIPFGACWFFGGKDFWLARMFRVRSYYELRIVCGMGFGMLVVNEYLQRIPFFGRTFDLYDIVFSALGLLLSYFACARLLVSRKLAA